MKRKKKKKDRRRYKYQQTIKPSDLGCIEWLGCVACILFIVLCIYFFAIHNFGTTVCSAEGYHKEFLTKNDEVEVISRDPCKITCKARGLSGSIAKCEDATWEKEANCYCQYNGP